MKKLFLALIILAAPLAFATNYYIATGATACGGSACSDSNNGTSKTTAWLHAPGMAGATGNASSHTCTAGDQFIFRGGDTWLWTSGNNFPFSTGSCGTSGSKLYYGVDLTWFAGGSFVRPIWSAGGAFPGAATTTMVTLHSNVVIDNIEETGTYVNQSTTNMAIFFCSGSCPFEAKNLYIHGWTVAAGQTDDELGIFWSFGGSGVVHDSVIDGTDATIPACLGTAPCAAGSVFFQGPCNGYNNYVNGIENFMNIDCTAQINFHDNNGSVQNAFDGVTHDNVFQNNSAGNGGGYYYNNFIHTLANGIFQMNLHAGSNAAFYVFNNVYSNTSTVVFSLSTLNSSSTTTTIDAFNNTIEPGPDAGSGPSNSCMVLETDATAISYLQGNNHCITSGGLTSYYPSGSCTGSNCTLTTTTNLVQSKTTAGGFGYTAAQTFPFSPTSAGRPTVGAGTNESSICAAIADATAQAACGQSSTLGVTEVSGEGGFVVSYPTLTPNPRPGSGAWDIGAYEFATSQAVTPSCTPGSGTYTANQTVTCTNPNSGTTVMCYSTSTTPATNGSGTGCTTGTQYTTALTVSANETLNVIAGTSTLTDSSVVTYSYVLQGGTPVCSPVGGTYIGTQSVALSQPQSLAIGYTTNGTSPVSNGSGGCSGSCTLYSGAISVASSETIKSIGMASGWTDSSIASCAYVINAPAATDMTMKGVTSSQGVTIVQ